MKRTLAFALGLLIVLSAQLCLASEARREAARGWWKMLGKDIKAELSALPETGRKAFREALIACSLYADAYSSDARQAECKRAAKFFTVEYAREPSMIEITFNAAMTCTAVRAAQLELDRWQGKRDTGFNDDDSRRAYLDVLQRAYRETREQSRRSVPPTRIRPHRGPSATTI